MADISKGKASLTILNETSTLCYKGVTDPYFLSDYHYGSIDVLFQKGILS